MNTKTTPNTHGDVPREPIRRRQEDKREWDSEWATPGGPAGADRALPRFRYSLIPCGDAARPSDPCRLRGLAAARSACPSHVTATRTHAARPGRACKGPYSLATALPSRVEAKSIPLPPVRWRASPRGRQQVCGRAALDLPVSSVASSCPCTGRFPIPASVAPKALRFESGKSHARPVKRWPVMPFADEIKDRRFAPAAGCFARGNGCGDG